MSDVDVQLDFVIDQDAEPVDLDQALARFLLALVRSEPADVSPAELSASPKNDDSRNHSTGAAGVKIQRNAE